MAQSNLDLDFPDLNDRRTHPSSSALKPNLTIVPEFPPFEQIEHGNLYSLSLSANTSAFTHGIHRFPAKYIPQIPRWALRQFASAESLVLDPFVGSGTTLVECLCAVQQAIGMDIDPLAQLIASAKVQRYDAPRLRFLCTKLLDSVPQNLKLFIPMQGVANFEHWFSNEAWGHLCGLYRAIESLECEPTERTFFLCIFSSILRRVSNADDQTQKTYVSGTLPKTPPPVMETFTRSLNRALSGIEELGSVARPTSRCHLVNGSAMAIPLSDGAVDLIITSPPYVDSVDYMYNLMLEYFWLGPKLRVPTRATFNSRRRNTVGSKNPKPALESVGEDLGGLVMFDELPNYRRAAAIAYFQSMAKHFSEAARVLRGDGRYVLVIGNSQAKTAAVPVHDCLVRLAGKAGLALEKAFAYRIRRHYMKFPRKGRGGIILMDWVIVLRKAQNVGIAGRLPMPVIELGHDKVAN